MNSHCTHSNHRISSDNARYCDQNTGHTIVGRKSHWISATGAASLLSKLKRYISRRYNQHIDRQAFNHLLTLDDNILKDMGVTKQDIVWASKLPVSEDAAAKMETIARRR